MATAPSSATTLDRSGEGATTALYRAAVGSVNTAYYQLHFGRFEAADRAGVSWNWAASLCTLNWMVFRQLWSAALVYVGTLVALALMVFGIGRLVFQFPRETEWGLLAAFAAAAWLLPGLYGNAIFHAHCRKRMAAALAANTTLPEAVAMLNRQASTRQRLIWLALANGVVVTLIATAYTLLPQAGMLPDKAGEARNLVVGRTTEAATTPAPAASAPATAASGPASAASAPALSASGVAPAPAQTASAPLPTATPALAAASAAASASIPTVAASAPRPPVAAASAPTTTTPSPAKAASASTAIPTPRTAASAARPGAKTHRLQAAPRSATAQTGDVATPPKPHGVPRYYINVGLFAQESNARSAHTRLLDAGLAAFTQEVKTAKGTLTRVRVGPFDSLGEADAAVERIRALGLDAITFQQ